MPGLETLVGAAKRVARGVLSRGPAYGAARARALAGGAVTVLMYHTLGRDDEDVAAWTVVRRSDFQRQIDWLRRHYDIVTLDQALSATRPTDAPPAVLTFDDGERGLHEHLLPIVERERIPITVYVATGQIVSGRPYWFDRVMNAVQLERPFMLALEGLPSTALGAERGQRAWPAVAALLEAFKRLDESARDAAAVALEAALASQPRRAFRVLAPMTTAQLREMAVSPWVTIGAHTHGHELLDRLPLDAALRSIEQSRHLLREWTGREVRHFAFPNGNLSPALMQGVERLGFDSAMSTVKGLWRAGRPRYDICRVPVGRWDDMDKFRLDLIGGAGAMLRRESALSALPMS